MAAAGSALAAARAGPVEKQLADALNCIKELEKLVAERDATILAMKDAALKKLQADMARVQAANDAELARLRAEMHQLCATGTKDAVPAAMPPVEAAAQPSAAGAAAEAKAEPSAKSSAYDELDALFTQDMIGLGDSADIRLIDAVHVIKVAQAGGRFQKRQDLPASAFLTTKPAYTIFVSYGWLDKAHPDPDGWHLGILGPLLDLFVRSATAANGGAAVAVGFFIDFCCLWQAPRSEAQGASFGRALRNINYLYANRKTYVWAQTKMPPGTARDYWARGWTFFELVVAGIVKDNGTIHPRQPSWSREDTVDCECASEGLEAFAKVRLLDLGKLEPTEHELKMGTRSKRSAIDPTQEEDFHRVALTCSGGVRRPPLALDAFSEELGRRSFTNGKSDHDVVVGLYARTIDEVMGSVTQLKFTDSNWGDEEAMQLAAVLPRCAELKRLFLGNNSKITDTGAAAIVANLPQARSRTSI